MKRRYGDGRDLPRWLRSPLTGDWTTSDEREVCELWPFVELRRHLDGAELWAAARRLDTVEVLHRAESAAPQPGDDDPMHEPPPVELVAAVLAAELARTAPERLR